MQNNYTVTVKREKMKMQREMCEKMQGKQNGEREICEQGRQREM